jgi:hypothetical protein
MNLLDDIRKGCSVARHAQIVITIWKMDGEATIGEVLEYVRARTGKTIDREDLERVRKFIPSSSSRKVPGVKFAPDTTPMMPRWDRPKVSV